MPNCEDFAWFSVVFRRGTSIKLEIGAFVIKHREVNGDFTGTFFHSDGREEEISGNCTASHISFDKPRSSPRHRYDGAVSDCDGFLCVKFGDGERNEHGGVPLNEQRQSKAESAALAGPDDWIAEQGTTFTEALARVEALTKET